MAVNITNIGFTGQFSTNFADRTGFVSLGDNNDIFYYAGTDFGRSAFVNPQSNGKVTATLAAGTVNVSSSNLLLLTDTVIPGTFSAGNIYGINAGAFSLVFQFNGFRVKPTRFDRGNAGISIYTYTNRSVDVSNDGVNWTNIGSPTNGTFALGAGVYETLFNSTSVDGYWSYIRYAASNVTASAHYHVEFKLYGKIKTTISEAGKANPIYSLDNLLDVRNSTKQDGDILYWNLADIYPKREIVYKLTRITMSGTVSASGLDPNFFVLDPNGAARSFNLPTIAGGLVTGHSIKLINLNPLFNITVLYNATTVTTIGGSFKYGEFYWDGTDWVVVRG